MPVVLMNACGGPPHVGRLREALADFADLRCAAVPDWAPDMAGSGESRFPAGRFQPRMVTAHIAGFGSTADAYVV
ncbi:MAG: hypothetical protein ACLS6O_03690 [Bifidobacterium sp.]